VVSGNELAAPVEIPDAAALESFNPWNRGFIAWERGLAADPPPVARTYTVAFYLDSASAGGSGGTPIFVVHYAPDPAGGPGFIYIPGPADEWYRLNIRTIITGGSDRWNPNGRWQYATAEWDAVMRGALGGRVSSAAQSAAQWLPTAGRVGAWTRGVVGLGGTLLAGLGGCLRICFLGERRRA